MDTVRRLVDMPGVLRSALAMGGVALIAALFAMAMIWSLAGPPEPFIDNLMARLMLDDVPCAAVGHGERRTPENDDFLPAAHVKVGRDPLGGRTK